MRGFVAVSSVKGAHLINYAQVEEAALNALSAIVHDFGEAALAVQMRLCASYGLFSNKT